MHDPREVLNRPTPPPDLTVRYGRGDEHVVDVRLPWASSGPSPLLVVLHGGFWRTVLDRRHVGPITSALAEWGYVVCVPEFRRVGQPGGGWPGTFDDVAAVTDTLVDLVVDAVGRDRVDIERIMLIGHSAGGHLALWAAGRHRLPQRCPWRRAEPLPVRGVVALAGVCDLALCSEQELGEGAANELLAGPPTVHPDRYAVTNPAVLLPLGVPVRLVHGTGDDRVPVAMSREYAAKARAAGDQVEVLELAGCEHLTLIDPMSAAWPHLAAAVDALAW